MVNEKRAIKLLQKLVMINSENFENRENNQIKIMDFIAKEMKDIGMDVRTYEFKKGLPNVVGIIKGKTGGKKLLLTPHADTVPAGKGWKHNPFGAEIKGGKVYGRGAEDCKINVVACLEAARSIKESGIELKGDLIVAVTSDEEMGSMDGIKPLIEKNILKFDYAVVADHNSFEPIVSQKGHVHLNVDIFGKRAHGAYPWLGENAIEKASLIINDLKKYRFIYRKHPLLREPTINIGVIHGGEKVNIVADRCLFEIDLRYLPGMDFDKIMRDFKKIISNRSKKFKITIEDHQKPYELNKNEPAAIMILKSAKKFKRSADFRGSDGVTAIDFFKKKNAIALGFGPRNVAHMTDEFVYVKDIGLGAKVFEDFIRNYLGVVG